MGFLCLCPAGKHRMDTRISDFPVTEEFRNELKQAVLGAYGEALSMAQASTLQTAPPQNPGQNMV